MKRLQRNWLRILAHLGALVPLVILIRDYELHHLTVNPIQEATQRTGKTALILLVLSLVCSPLNKVTGWKQTIQVRRPLGLYTFFYACLHLCIFAVIDYGLDPGELWQAVSEKPYILVGLTGFLLLTPLAFTSTRGWMRRLGKRWTRLHRLVYVVAPLIVLHFYWSVKADYRQPLLYGAGVALLLVLRLPPIRSALRTYRTGRSRARARATGRSVASPSDS